MNHLGKKVGYYYYIYFLDFHPGDAFNEFTQRSSREARSQPQKHKRVNSLGGVNASLLMLDQGRVELLPRGTSGYATWVWLCVCVCLWAGAPVCGDLVELVHAAPHSVHVFVDLRHPDVSQVLWLLSSQQIIHLPWTDRRTERGNSE